MDAFGEVARTLCFCAVGCSVLAWLLPKGDLRKTGRAVLGIFFLLAVFSPVGKLRAGELDRSLFDGGVRSEASGEEARDAVRAAAEAAAGAEVQKILTNAGVVAKEIRVQSHIEPDGVICIDRVLVETDETEKAKEALGSLPGIGDVLCVTRNGNG